MIFELNLTKGKREEIRSDRRKGAKKFVQITAKSSARAKSGLDSDAQGFSCAAVPPSLPTTKFTNYPSSDTPLGKLGGVGSLGSTVAAAFDPRISDTPGSYLDDSKVANVAVVAHSSDPLWTVTEQIIGEKINNEQIQGKTSNQPFSEGDEDELYRRPQSSKLLFYVN
ncbi:hypothetical protein B0H14DRAFT_2618284 [Mycena olivaceomarginata]|nr:hypothetical protein B0H14DRAFT_2618284 [Mycena olivaceomarginata]